MSEAERWSALPEPHVEASPRWVRVRAGDTLVAGSRQALLLSWYGPHTLPTYCIPAADVSTDLLRSAAGTHALPHTAPHDVVVDGQVLAGTAFRFEEPPPTLAAVDGYWTFAWGSGLQWFEEALEVHVHARDPRKRVDAVPSERHVRVELAGELLAESRRPLAVFETTLPTRWYLPAADIRQDLLDPSDTVTRCPYKGTATYWSVRIGDTVHRDLAWSYPEPVIECPRLAGLTAFFNERVDLVVDGVPETRPLTPWSV